MKSVAPATPNFLAYTGDNVTSASRQRTEGLMQLFNEQPEAKINNLVVGQWGYDIPQQRTATLLQNRPSTNVIWAANGPMAIGARRSIGASDRVRIGSVNWDEEEIQALQRGDIDISIGGHFMTGGWSLVMLYDYHHGIDFIDDGGAYQQRRIFEEITQNNLHRFLPLLNNRNWQSLDFTVMSKVKSPKLKSYHFTLSELLKKQR